MNCKTIVSLVFAALFCLVSVASNVEAGSNHRDADGRIKVLYHIDGNDVGVAKYAMALINKHMEAEGGPDKIDIKVVVHGPALKLFDKETVDPVLKKKLAMIIDKGVQPEMCQVSMKLFNMPLASLASGFVPTEHPVAVKRIADLQEQGYLYCTPSKQSAPFELKS
ncbi:MAG: DsrE family protein [Nitrospinae bacterium]|nr:DsrE family protein [Nitrospinota bacterium]